MTLSRVRLCDPMNHSMPGLPVHHQLNGHEFEQTLGDGEGEVKPGVLQSMGSQRVRHNLAIELQQH